MALAVAAGFGWRAPAAVAVLNDLNSSLNFHTEAADGPELGLNSWTVDGVNHLSQGWFWYRVGNQTREYRLDGTGPLTHLVTSTTDFNGNAGDDDLVAIYEDNETVITPETFTVIVHHALSGGAPGSGDSSLLTDFRIDNSGNDPMDISFFLYRDFELSGTPADDVLTIIADSSVQLDSSTKAVTQLGGPAAGFAAGLFPGLRDVLDDGALSSLAGTGLAGPGDVESGFEWRYSIGSNEGVSGALVTTLTTLTSVPEASTLAPAVFVLAGMVGWRWRNACRTNGS